MDLSFLRRNLHIHYIMFEKKRLEVYSDDQTLEITLNWFSPKAYFFAVFSVFWMGFLAFWYFIAFSTGGPLIMKLFPILHVLAGLGMSYYTLCLFFNKTYLDIQDDYLTVINKPIPWWKGDRAIATKDIQQLYVKEKITNSKNGTQRSYQLRCKLMDNSDKELLAMGTLESQELKEVEDYIERFLGIEDTPVAGEYGRSGFQNKNRTPRRQRRDFTRSFFNHLYHAQLNQSVTFQNESLELINISQFDWDNGNSDKVLQLINYQKQERLLHLQQNGALLEAFESKSLTLLDMGNIRFEQKAPPPSLQYEGRKYLLAKNLKGYKFIHGQGNGIAVEQWLYAGEGGKILQVIGADRSIEYALLNPVPEDQVADGLELKDLENRKLPDELELGRELDEEDFV